MTTTVKSLTDGQMLKLLDDTVEYYGNAPEQLRASVDDRCRYSGPADAKCAIGRLLEPAVLDWVATHFNSSNLNDVLRRSAVPLRLTIDAATTLELPAKTDQKGTRSPVYRTFWFLRLLQRLHDDHRNWDPAGGLTTSGKAFADGIRSAIYAKVKNADLPEEAAIMGYNHDC